MKIVRLKGLKPELVDLDYGVIMEEKDKYEKNGKHEKSFVYSKLLNNLKENSTAEEIENEVNNIIDSNRENVHQLKKEIKKLEKEISLLSMISKRENDSDVSSTISSMIINL